MSKMFESNLDERQEQALLQIEHNGCWLAFWGLLAALVVQSVVLHAGADQLAGEWLVFMVLALYLSFGCMREGIWDRSLRPDGKTNLGLSAVAGLVMGVVMFSQVFANYPDKVVGSVAAGVFAGGLTFVACWAALSLMAAAYCRRRAALEAEPEDEE